MPAVPRDRDSFVLGILSFALVGHFMILLVCVVESSYLYGTI